MKNLMKVLCLVLVLVMVVAPVASFATFSNISEGDLGINTQVQEVGNGVYGLLRTIAVIVAVCMIVYMAIQWFIAAPAKKAELKGRMWSMAIGVVLLCGGIAILNILETAVQTTFPG